MFKKVLIANRGEIAVRIMRTLKEMNIGCVAVYSDVDRNALHVRHADEAYNIGTAEPRQSYLNAEKILQAAQKAKVDAIHPGYGFLSENGKFAKLCEEAKIVFIGPSSKTIADMGDKIRAREIMRNAGVPVVPGGIITKAMNDEEILKLADSVGFPIMVKAAMGGGGKGMRMVSKREDLMNAIEGASREALSAFGDQTIYLERKVQNPRHIEVQIFGDQFDNVIHYNERECSIQRRHQKIIEEAPGNGIDSKLREKIGSAAILAGKTTHYLGAGTVEFLMDDTGEFYFLEMNTRLQVEHPVTEFTVNKDLVREQIEVACGKKLDVESFSDSPRHFSPRGHAIEARIYAENPYQNFMPSPGLIQSLDIPHGPNVRFDGGVYQGFTVPSHYDPMIGKLIVWANNRTLAIAKMQRALREMMVRGIITNIDFLLSIVSHPDFQKGRYTTHFIEQHSELFENSSNISAELELATVIGAAMFRHLKKEDGNLAQSSRNDTSDPEISRWRMAIRSY